jgi:phytanoyl-CoA hydroxylase
LENLLSEEDPRIVDAVASLIGEEIFCSPVYNVRPKVPKIAAGAVPWHQDKSYWPDANANPVITVWIPLVDSTVENGCLHVKPRTQKKRLLKWHQETYSSTGYTALHESQLGKTVTVALPMTAGSAVLFNDRLLHMSTPNNSDGVRWSVDLRYQPTDQDPMPQHGAGFLVRSRKHTERVATLEDWLHQRLEHEG